MRLIGERLPVTRIADGPEDSRRLECANATFEAMRAGAPVIAQAVLRNPREPDLRRRRPARALGPPRTSSCPARSRRRGRASPRRRWARSLALPRRRHQVPHARRSTPTRRAAVRRPRLHGPGLGLQRGARAHPGLSRRPRGSCSGATGRSGWSRGTGCFERLARVDHDAVGDTRTGTTLAAIDDRGARLDPAAARAKAPAGTCCPSRPFPSSTRTPATRSDAPWHRAKRRIADELDELTLLPAMNPERRRAAHARGIRRWDDPRVSAAALGIPDKYAAQCDAVLAVNRGERTRRPARAHRRRRRRLADAGAARVLRRLRDRLATSPTTSRALPEVGGQKLIFQVGCGRWEAGEWRFAQWTVDRLDRAGRGDGDRRRGSSTSTGCAGHAASPGRTSALVHWSAAETSTLDTAYNSARTRHGRPDWPASPGSTS